MIENILKPMPVGQIILNANTPARSPRFEHYLIPYYQRGYRWDEINVEALLDDIHNFIELDEGKYCLQPIVVVPRLDENGHNIWEVVDGQQRLITMYIIFKFLDKSRYKIIFEKREKSTEFLENLSAESYNHDNPDFHFMSKAHEIISNWFSKKTENEVGYIDDFNSRLTKKVEVIWYQIEELKALDKDEDNSVIESKKIDIFNRLNIGKIPLTDAELIRALLLSKIKYGLSERESIMRQSEISNEWYDIEMSLRKEEFWYFLNDGKLSETSSAIELIFKLIAGSESKNYSTYYWFENFIKNGNPKNHESLSATNLELLAFKSNDVSIENNPETRETPKIEKENAEYLWKKTKEYFHKFTYWFQTDELYHHLGFLLAESNNNLETLLKIIDNSNTTKTKFKDWALTQVKEKIADIDIDSISYESSQKKLVTLFLLFNIVSTEKLQKHQNNRFPFNLYKKVLNEGGWSIEHIHAQQSKEMKEPEAIKKWLYDTFIAIENITSLDKVVLNTDENDDGSVLQHKNEDLSEIKNEVSRMLHLETVDIPEFNLLKSKIISMFDSDSVHVLDNLALLAKRDNSSLNNAIFPVKRNRIIELQKQGKFIPLSTMNVFLKYYSNSDLQPFYWSKADKNEYYQNLRDTLKPYLN